MASLDTHDDGSCAIANGEVYCWGPAFGNDAPEKFAVEDFTNFEQVAVYAGGRVCALRETGDLWCFQQRGEPKQLGSDFVQLEAGASHACGLKQVGSEQHLYCWGENRHGQLGVGDRDRRSEPTAVLGLVGPVSMFDITQADAPATCAHDDEGMKCWGNNTSRHFAPVPYVQPTPTLIEAWQNLE